MTDITINIKSGSDNSEPKVTTTTDNAKTVVPKAETKEETTPKQEAPKEEMKEEKPSEKDEPQKMDMTEEEHAKMGSNK